MFLLLALACSTPEPAAPEITPTAAPTAAPTAEPAPAATSYAITLKQCGDELSAKLYPPSGSPSADDLLIVPGERTGVIKSGTSVEAQSLQRYGWVVHLPDAAQLQYRWYSGAWKTLEEAIAGLAPYFEPCHSLVYAGAIDLTDGKPARVLIQATAFSLGPLQTERSTLAQVKAHLCGAGDCTESENEQDGGIYTAQGSVSLYTTEDGKLAEIINKL